MVYRWGELQGVSHWELQAKVAKATGQNIKDSDVLYALHYNLRLYGEPVTLHDITPEYMPWPADERVTCNKCGIVVVDGKVRKVNRGIVSIFSRSWSVSKIIAETWLTSVHDGPHIHHRDKNCANSRVENLYYSDKRAKYRYMTADGIFNSVPELAAFYGVTKNKATGAVFGGHPMNGVSIKKYEV